MVSILCFFIIESAPLPPAPPQRETPLPFAHPHVSVRFGIGGHLVTVLPVKPSSHTSAKVEIIAIQVCYIKCILIVLIVSVSEYNT